MKFYNTKDILHNKKVDNDFRYCKNVIYIAKNKEGKSYVGETSSTLIDRVRNHLRKKGTEFEKAINRKNMDHFEWAILQDNLTDIEKRFEREKFFIKKYDTYNKGYNMTKGGGGTKGLKHTPQNNEKNSLRRTEHFKNPENRKEQSKANLLAHAINPKQGEEHSKRMVESFDPKTEEGRKKREQTSKKQKDYYENNEVVYVSRYKKKPFFAYKNGQCIGFFISQSECSRMLNVSKAHISKVLNGKRNTTGGYEFKYMDKTGYLLKDL